MHSDNSSGDYHFSFTCNECTFRGNRTHDTNYVSIKYVDGLGGSYRKWSESDKYPERCRECNRKAKRHTRMVNRLSKIWRISYDLEDKRYSRPKLITFALPSIVTFDSSPEEELRKLKTLLPAARRILMNKGILGGVYVPEVTTRSYEFMGTRCFKHHAHIHMVALAPWMPPKALKRFSECLIPLGLGRINYVAPSGHWKSAKQKVASYISKYLCKDGRRTSSFGIYRGYKFHSSSETDSTSGTSAKT